MVSRCLRCGKFKEREEMESRATENSPIVTMCIGYWDAIDAINGQKYDDRR